MKRKGSAPEYYLGIMSGTSADGIDLALINTQASIPKLLEHSFVSFDKSIHDKITSLYTPSNNEIDRSFELGILLAKAYAKAVTDFLANINVSPSSIVAIGNHGQTVRHRPIKSAFNDERFTVQIGCHQTLATLTGIRVIGDFRTKDIVYGGQGAPLVPAFHQALFPQRENDYFLVNIGGIANITFLPANENQHVMGFDTGPGNALLDSWIQRHLQRQFDQKGKWAAQGKVNKHLLDHMLEDKYFKMPAPKSTGREYFHLPWLDNQLQGFDIPHVDVQATLSALTASSISNAIQSLSSSATIYVAGGGRMNNHLILQLKALLHDYTFCEIDEQLLNSDALEAMAFAWLAFAYDKKIYGNIPAVTGASKEVVLGVEFNP